MSVCKCGKQFKNIHQLIVHKNKGCQRKVCQECDAKFWKRRDYDNHIKKRQNISCDHCLRKFCTDSHYQKHRRSIQKPKEDFVTDLDQKVYPFTGYECYEEYQNILFDQKKKQIEDYEKVTQNYTLINRRIDSRYTYKDLEKQLLDIYCSQNNAFKINIGFGFILYNTVKDEFKYYYNSSNNMLFEYAVKIASRKDLNNFMKKVVNIDLATSYYLKKPSSGWVLAGLPNIEISIFQLKNEPIG